MQRPRRRSCSRATSLPHLSTAAFVLERNYRTVDQQKDLSRAKCANALAKANQYADYAASPRCFFFRTIGQRRISNMSLGCPTQTETEKPLGFFSPPNPPFLLLHYMLNNVNDQSFSYFFSFLWVVYSQVISQGKTLVISIF